jgi:chemotaxis protein methyltransferase CheR
MFIDKKEILGDHEFSRLSRFIYDYCGIKLPPEKKTMLEARISKRLRAVNSGSFKEYCDYVFSPVGMENELVNLIDVVTTNKTDFFREPNQFVFLTKTALNEVSENAAADGRHSIKIWSAGCSTGEEPYTLAMVLSEYYEKNPRMDFSITASDISMRVLQKAMAGIFDLEAIKPVPNELKKKYLLKSKDPQKKLVKVSNIIKDKILFYRINFMEDDFGINEKCYDIF